MASRRIEDLHPKLQGICKQFLLACESAGVDVILTCTYRSHEEQAQLFAQGRTMPGKIVTKAKPGQSKHNHMEGGKPAALAFDIVPIVDGKAVWDDKHPHWRIAGEIGENLGLNWYGRPGAIFREMPHFELRGLV